MKRLQEVEFTTRCKNLSTFLARLEKRHPKFYEIWGDVVAYNISNGVEEYKDLDVGYILHTINDDDYFYVCFIATKPEQVIDGEPITDNGGDEIPVDDIISKEELSDVFIRITVKKIGRMVSAGMGDEPLRRFWLNLIGGYELIPVDELVDYKRVKKMKKDKDEKTEYVMRPVYRKCEPMRVYPERNELINTLYEHMLPLCNSDGSLTMSHDNIRRIYRVIDAWLYKEGLRSLKGNLRLTEALDSVVDYIGHEDANKVFASVNIWEKPDNHTEMLHALYKLIQSSGYKYADGLLKILPYLGNTSETDIGKIFGVSQQAINKRVHKIRNILAEIGITPENYKNIL